MIACALIGRSAVMRSASIAAWVCFEGGVALGVSDSWLVWDGMSESADGLVVVGGVSVWVLMFGWYHSLGVEVGRIGVLAVCCVYAAFE